MRTLAFIFILFFCSESELFAKKINKDSLIKILNSNSADTAKISACLVLSASFKETSSDSSLFYCKLAAGFIKPTTFPKWKAKVNLFFCRLYNYTMGDFSTAEKYVEEALKYAIQTKNSRLIGDVYLSRGAVYGSQGNYEKAIGSLLKAEKYFTVINYQIGLSSVYNDIGIINYNQQDYKNALHYYKKGMNIKAVRNRPEDMASAYQNISGVYYDLGNYDSAFHYVDLGLKISLMMGDLVGTAMSYSGKAMVLRKMNRFGESLKCEENAKKLAIETGDKYMIANCYNGIALINHHEKKYDAAIENYLLSIKINKEIKARKELAEAYGGISKAYEELKNYKNAFNYYKLYTELNDSLSGEKIKKNVHDIQIKYETAKKEKEIALLNKTKTQDSLKIELQELQVKDKDLQIEKRQGQIKYLIVIAIILAAFGIWIYNALRNKQKANSIIQLQKQLVDEKQKEITDSITYAKRLQQAILPPDKLIKKTLPESFVFYKPKDIVAGDFYWCEVVKEAENELVLIAAADCTGHGVPGAMVSIVCSDALNRTIKEFKITEPGKILDKARELVLETFSKSESEVKDGMDISLCSLNTKTNEIKWSGANNPLWYFQNEIFKEIKGHKQPIGMIDLPTPFPTHTLTLQKGDSFYLITDGFADQFGGPKGKKFKYKHLQETLISNLNLSLDQQKLVLNESFDNWKGNLEQVDDVCIIGVRL